MESKQNIKPKVQWHPIEKSIRDKSNKKIERRKTNGRIVSTHRKAFTVLRIFKSLLIIIGLLALALGAYLVISQAYFNPTHMSFLDILGKAWTFFKNTGQANGPTIAGSAIGAFLVYQLFARRDEQDVEMYKFETKEEVIIEEDNKAPID